MSIRTLWAAMAACWLGLAMSAEELKSTLTGDLEAQVFGSKILQRDEKLWIWLPPGYRDPANAERKYPVIYLLDGDDMFDVRLSSRGKDYQADEILTELITSGKIEPIIAVAVGKNTTDKTGRGEGRYDEFLPYPDSLMMADLPAPHGQVFPEFMVTEVLPFVAARYRVTTDPQKTAIAGLSYGAVAALHTLIHHPGKFGLAVLESLSFQVGNGQYLRDTEHLVAAGRRIALGVGTAETGGAKLEIDQAWVKAIEKLSTHLRGAALPPEVQLTIEPGARHGGAAFTRRLPNDLIFLFAPPPQPAESK